MWPPLPYMDFIFSWQWTRKCGNSTGDLYQSVSTWNIRVPYQSETGSRCWMQQTFALWQTKHHSEIRLVFLLFNDAPSIYWMLTVCLPRSRWSQAIYSPIHRTPSLPTVYHSVIEPAAFNSACATRRLEKLLTIERIYIGFVLCYVTLLYILGLFCVMLPYCILFMVYLSFCLQLCCCKSFFIQFRPSFLTVFLLFFLPPLQFSVILYTLYFPFSYWYTDSPSNNRRSNGFITSFSSCSEGKCNSDIFRKCCNIPFSKWYTHYVGLILILILCALILNVSK
jgi:hypothetical protein